MVQKRASTIVEVARRSRVSVSSVSRVLSGHPDVSQRMRERVLKASAALEYDPHSIARSLRTGVTHTVGFLVGGISNPVFAEIIKGASDVAHANGYAVMMTNSEGDSAIDAAQLTLLVQRRVDGVIVSTTDEESEIFALDRLEDRIPLVVLDRYLPPDSSVSAVYADHAHGVADATTHLLDNGHRAIALITGSRALRPANERLLGFLRAHEAFRVTPRPDLICMGNLQPEFGRKAASKLLEAASPPTAIIAGGNRLLVGVLESLQARGLRVGDDIALVSCDDVDLNRLYIPPISAVVRDTHRMGQVAMELLLKTLREPTAPSQSITIPTHFVQRRSSELKIDIRPQRGLAQPQI
jgi:LacI family transcriptional regulator, galactose operon repressor